MTITEQIKALAELDEIREAELTVISGWFGIRKDNKHKTTFKGEYTDSYDAIIPLIQKLGKVGAVSVHVCTWGQCTYTMNATPSQLCEALLRATGKWKE